MQTLTTLSRQSRRIHHLNRYMSASAKVDIVQQMKIYPFLKQFMYDPDDPIKQKWQMIQDWSVQCQNDMQITERQLKVLRQRYELTPLYDDESLSENNPFLKDVFERISDPDKYDKTNQTTLSDAQFEAVKRIQNETIYTNHFLSKVPEMINSAKDAIDTLPIKKKDYAQFEKNVGAWGKYRFLSYAHPKMVQMYQAMIDQEGTLSNEQIKDVVHYMQHQNRFQFNNVEFKDALKWFLRMEWTFEHAFADNIYQKEILEYFEILLNRYKNIKAVLDDTTTLKRCEYEQSVKNEIQTFEPQVKDIETWLRKISKKEKDPLVVWLKDNLDEDAEYDAVQNAIVNRFQLDIGGLMDVHGGILVPLLHNEHICKLRPEEIGRERQRVLVGTELTSEYLEELKQIVRSAQLEFAKTL